MTNPVRRTTWAALKQEYALSEPLPITPGGTSISYKGEKNALEVVVKTLSSVHSQWDGFKGIDKPLQAHQSLMHKQLQRPLEAVAYPSPESDTLTKYALVYEYVPGKDLEEHRGVRRFGVSECLDLLESVLDPLDHLHAAGIIHRDIKPRNLIYDGEKVTIIDYGSIATKESTGSTMVVTPGYTAPELLAGEDAHPQSDFYSLGMTLYTLATGVIPDKIVPQREILHVLKKKKVDSGLREIIRNLTRTQSDERYINVSSIKEAIALARKGNLESVADTDIIATDNVLIEELLEERRQKILSKKRKHALDSINDIITRAGVVAQGEHGWYSVFWPLKRNKLLTKEQYKEAKQCIRGIQNGMRCYRTGITQLVAREERPVEFEVRWRKYITGLGIGATVGGGAAIATATPPVILTAFPVWLIAYYLLPNNKEALQKKIDKKTSDYHEELSATVHALPQNIARFDELCDIVRQNFASAKLSEKKRKRLQKKIDALDAYQQAWDTFCDPEVYSYLHLSKKDRQQIPPVENIVQPQLSGNAPKQLTDSNE